MNKCTQKTDTRMGGQREEYTNPKRLPQRNSSNQLEIHNVPTDDVENTNSTN